MRTRPRQQSEMRDRKTLEYRPRRADTGPDSCREKITRKSDRRQTAEAWWSTPSEPPVPRYDERLALEVFEGEGGLVVPDSDGGL